MNTARNKAEIYNCTNCSILYDKFDSAQNSCTELDGVAPLTVDC